jgi:hypothetical protein
VGPAGLTRVKDIKDLCGHETSRSLDVSRYVSQAAVSARVAFKPIESSSERLQASREWLRARRSTCSPSEQVEIHSDLDSVGGGRGGESNEWHSNAYRAAAACKQLHQAEAKIIDAALAGRGAGKFRRKSGFKDPPKNNVDRNFVARVWFVAKMIEQKSWNCRARGKHGGSIGAVGLEVLRTLLFVIKKVDGRLYPSLEAIAKMSRKSKQAIVAAIKVLERMGFITIHRRVKRIQTPFGVRVVQDSNAYEFHLPISGLGALAMAVFCPRSESTKLDANQHKHENREEIACGSAEKKLCREEVDRWWLADLFQAGNGGFR